MKKFSLNDFSGGLNLAASPESLPANQTPSCSNVDMLESGIIESRRGWALSVPEAFTADPIRALHRHYTSSGLNAWVAVADGNLWSYDGETQVWKTLEAEAATDGGTVVTDVASSGSAYVQVGAGPVTFTLPACTRFKMRIDEPTASVSIDGDDPITITGPLYDSGDLAGTTHTITATGNQSMSSLKVVGAVRKQVTLTDAHSFSFYDDGVTPLMFNLDYTSTAAGYGRRCYVTATSVGYKVGFVRYHSAYVNYPFVHNSSTAGARVAGWHTVSLSISASGMSVIVDGTTYSSALTYSGTLIATPYLYIGTCEATGLRYESSAAFVNIDDYRVNGLVTDKFDTVDSGWVAIAPTTFVQGTYSAFPIRYIDPTAPVAGSYTGRLTYYNDTNPATAPYANVCTGTRTIDTSTGSAVYNLRVDYFQYIDGTIWSSKDANLNATDELFGILTIGDKVYYASANTALRVYNGSTAAAVSSGPKGPYMVEHKGRLFITGAAGDSSLLLASSNTDVTDWTSEYAWSDRLMAKDAGHISQGLRLWNDRIYQFTTAGLFSLECVAIADPTTWVGKALTNRYGCIAPRSIATAPNAMVWLGAEAIYTYGELAGVNPLDGAGFARISDDIEPLLRELTPTAMSNAVGVIYRGKYWLAVDADGTGTNSTVLVYRFATEKRAGAWTRYDYPTLDISTMLTVRGDESGLFAGTTGGLVVKLDTSRSDNGAAISANYTFPRLAAGGFESVKHTRTTHFGATATTSQNITLSIVTDDIDPPPQTVTVTPSTAARPIRMLTTSRGRSIQPTLAWDAVEQDVAIQSITVTYTDSPIR